MADGDDNAGDSDQPLPRRRLLTVGALIASGGLAGCGGGGDGDATTTAPSETSTAPTTAPPDATAATTSTTSTSTTAGSTSTEPTSTTAPTTSLPEPSLVSAPMSAISPLDGFARADWLEEADPEIIRVTNLKRQGPGSLDEALRTEGPRIIVFEVGGVIDQNTWGLDVEQGMGQVFVAGQTAPPPGITVINGYVSVSATDVIFQHLRVRPGDGVGSQADAITAENESSNVIFDHCSASWSIDEMMSTGGGPTNENITFSNNLLAEALHDSIHPKGPHAMGTLIMNDSGPVAILGNVYTSCRNRHPRLKGGTTSAFVNNYVYNYDNGVRMGQNSDEPTQASIVGNHYEAGPLTDTNEAIVKGSGDPTPLAFVEDVKTTPAAIPVIGTGFEEKQIQPVWPWDKIEPMAAADVRSHNLGVAGARPADRTPHDERIISEIRTEESELIDSQSEVGGYPELESTQRALDPPPFGDGFTEWLFQHTLAVTYADQDPPE